MLRKMGIEDEVKRLLDTKSPSLRYWNFTRSDALNNFTQGVKILMAYITLVI